MDPSPTRIEVSLLSSLACRRWFGLASGGDPSALIQLPVSSVALACWRTTQCSFFELASSSLDRHWP